MDPFASGFANVERATEPGAFVHYLDRIHSLPFFGELKQQSFCCLGIRPGASVLEIGCGKVTDANALATKAGKSGRVIGIDVSSTILGAAQKPPDSCGCAPEYLLCDAQSLAFPDGSFDAVRTDRVLQHTKDPFSVVREMARVTRLSGKVVACEPD